MSRWAGEINPGGDTVPAMGGKAARRREGRGEAWYLDIAHRPGGYSVAVSRCDAKMARPYLSRTWGQTIGTSCVEINAQKD